MPKHNTYQQDENISDNDIVLGSDAENNLKTKNFRIGSIKEYIIQAIGNIVSPTPSYKVYTALLTQSGTDAPVATVLENTLGDIVWNYEGIGVYTCTSSGLFTENKTTFNISSKITFVGIGGDLMYTYINDDSSLSVNTYKFITPDFKASNDMLDTNCVEIRVYN